MPSSPPEAARTRGTQSPIIPIVGGLVRGVPGTISLGQGVVFYGPPPEALQRLQTFGSDARDHLYGPVEGSTELRSQIHSKLRQDNGIDVGEARRVVVTAGGNMAFMNAMMAIVDAGDEVIIPLPYYFNHEMAVGMLGGKVITVPTGDDYQLDPDAIRRVITPRTRAVVTVSPNNPTGAVYSEETLRAVNELCRERGVFHVSDEAYEYFTYDGVRHFSPASLAGSEGHTISLFSLSKAYGFASWRIGYMLVPEQLETAIRKVQDTVLICPPLVSQHAAAAALQVGAVYPRTMLREIADSRRLVLEQLRTIEEFCAVVPTAGAFYFLLRLETELDALKLVERLVREHRVAVIPGGTFGLDDGCYLRVSYGALRPAEVGEGVGRLVNGLQVIVGG